MGENTTWVSFALNERKEGAKTDTWEVWNLHTSAHLGAVRWFARWRKYAFYPASDTVFHDGCLRQIATFCELEMRRRTIGRRAFIE